MIKTDITEKMSFIQKILDPFLSIIIGTIVASRLSRIC